MKNTIHVNLKNRTIPLLLAAVLLLSLLAGCGSKSKDPSAEPADPAGSAAQTQQAEEVPTGNVYVSEFIPVKKTLMGGLGNLLYSNGRFLSNSYEKIRDDTPEGVIPEYEGEYWVYGTVLYWIGMDGSLEKVENYEPMEVPEDSGESSTYTQNVFLNPAGEIVSLDVIYVNSYDGPDDVELYSDEWYQLGYYEYMNYTEDYYLRILNDDGSEKRCIDLSALGEGSDSDYVYVSQCMCDAAGNYYFNCEQSIWILDPEGELISSIESDRWFESMVLLPDGRIAVCWWGENGKELAVVDTETGTIGEETWGVSSGYGLIPAPAGDAYDFYYTDGSNLMGYSLTTQTAEKVLNWINCDVEPSYGSNNVAILPDGRIVTSVSEWNDDYTEVKVELAVIKSVPASSVPQKTKLVLATQSLSWEARSAIIDFNKRNSDYRIEVRDYSEYNTDEDYSAGLTKLTTEIFAGNVPDILDLNGIPFDKLISKGQLADLYPMLDADPELSRDDLLAGPLHIRESDGALYGTVSNFEIMTALGAARVVGDKPGWTLDEFNAALASMPEGCEPFGSTTTREEMLRFMLNLEMDSLVDWESGTCNFDTPAFRNILEFAGRFRESIPDDYWQNWSEEDEDYSRIAAGKQMLLQTWLYDFYDYQTYSALFGGDVTFIGYPVSEGTGNALVNSGSGYALSAACKNPDAAWQFLRTFFTEKYQEETYNGFPTNRAVFRERLADAMKQEYMKDSEGNYMLDENGEKIPLSRGGWSSAGIDVQFYALTQADADKLMELIETTERVLTNDFYDTENELVNIIVQDTAAYFAGQKSLADTAKQLQSKLFIYINEQR